MPDPTAPETISMLPGMQSGSTRPIPDPTSLTTAALQREIAALQELVEARLTAEKDLTTERFRQIEEQFSLVERNRIEQKQDTKESLAAALTTAKEAVGLQTQASERSTAKTEASFSEQLSQQSQTQSVATAGVTRALDDLKERIAHIETIREGGKQAYAGITAAVVALAAVVAIAATVLAIISTGSAP